MIDRVADVQGPCRPWRWAHLHEVEVGLQAASDEVANLLGANGSSRSTMVRAVVGAHPANRPHSCPIQPAGALRLAVSPARGSGPGAELRRRGERVGHIAAGLASPARNRASSRQHPATQMRGRLDYRSAVEPLYRSSIRPSFQTATAITQVTRNRPTTR